MGGANSKSQSNNESKHSSRSSRAVDKNKKSQNMNATTESKQTSLVVANTNNCSNLHEVNLDFLIRVGVVPPLAVLIYEYADSYDIVRYDFITSNISLDSSLRLFQPNPRYIADCKQAESIARDHILEAGPLDGLDEAGRKNPNALLRSIRITKTLDGIEFTFEGSPLQLAIMLLDQTIKAAPDSTVKITDEGQAERVMALIQELTPEKMFEAQVQAHFAAPKEDEKANEFKNKNDERSKVLDNAFDKIKANNPAAAGKIIRDYIINTKPAVITDNQYFLNLLQLIPVAFNLLIKRSNELKDELYGDQANQYCFKIIGTIDRVLPFKLRKILRTGLNHILYKGRQVDRTLDVSDSVYLAGAGWELSFNRFFDDVGARDAAWWRCVHLVGGGLAAVFTDLYRCQVTSLNISFEKNSVKYPNQHLGKTWR